MARPTSRAQRQLGQSFDPAGNIQRQARSAVSEAERFLDSVERRPIQEIKEARRYKQQMRSLAGQLGSVKSKLGEIAGDAAVRSDDRSKARSLQNRVDSVQSKVQSEASRAQNFIAKHS